VIKYATILQSSIFPHISHTPPRISQSRTNSITSATVPALAQSSNNKRCTYLWSVRPVSCLAQMARPRRHHLTRFTLQASRVSTSPMRHCRMATLWRSTFVVLRRYLTISRIMPTWTWFVVVSMRISRPFARLSLVELKPLFLQLVLSLATMALEL
jgi:hypothetical protein